MGHKYRSNDSMSSLINDDYQLLHVLSRFGITLGFGDKTVGEVCDENKVDVGTFLAVCNFVSSGLKPSFDEYGMLSVPQLLFYLRNSHNFFLDFMLPSIRRKFLLAVDCSSRNEIGFLILKFFDDYVEEIRRHQEQEQDTLFQYVSSLIQGRRPTDFSLSSCENNSLQSHKNMDAKLADLKNIIIRYCPSASNSSQLNDALLHLFEFEADLLNHTQLEDSIFIPMVSILECQVEVSEDEMDASMEADTTVEKGVLSAREKQIIKGVIKGLTNKEIADRLNLSIHTILTHRRNIAKKLEIHSSAGLVIYGIVNGIVSIDDIKEAQ